MGVHSRKRDFDSDQRRGGEKEPLCTSRPPTLRASGSSTARPGSRRSRRSSCCTVFPRRCTSSTTSFHFCGSVSCRCAQLPRHGVQRSSTTDCPATDLLNLAVEAHGGLKRWSVLGDAPGLNYASDDRDVDGMGQDRYGRNHTRALLACCRLTAFDQARPVNVQWILLSSRLACFTTGMSASAPAHKLATFSYHNLASVFAPNCASARAIPNFASDPDQQFTTSPGLLSIF